MNKLLLIGSAAACGLLIAGCNIGNAPSGMSGEEAKDYIAKMKPEDKIRAIANSPMPGAQKEAEYKKIEQETGVKASDVLGNAGSIPGAGATK